MPETYVSYLRVSTRQQGESGLGLEAQRAAVAHFLNGGKLIQEVIEIETGKRNDRPMLAQAFAACRLYQAKLVIAKLDRLSRNAHFLLGLEQAGVDFVAADMPYANRLTIGIMALMAEQEGQAISKRTKEALAAAKSRGTVLGGVRHRDGLPINTMTAGHRQRAIETRQGRATSRAREVAQTIQNLQESGAESLRAIAMGLTRAGVPTTQGKHQWTPTQVKRVLERL